MDSALEDVQFRCTPELSEDTYPAYMFLHFELYGWRKPVHVAFTYLAFLHLLINEMHRQNICSQNITERQMCWSLIPSSSNCGWQRIGKWWMNLQEMVAILLACTVWTFLVIITIGCFTRWLSIWYSGEHLLSLILTLGFLQSFLC